MSGTYPTIEQILNLARVYLNDVMPGLTGTIGEGTQLFDSWPPALTVLNDAIDTYQQDIGLHGVPTFIQEAIITPITPINSSLGPGTPNPAAWQNLGFAGFFDGETQYSTPVLPSNLILPLRLWQRTSGASEDLSFMEVYPISSGLESVRQGIGLGRWEWRGDLIWFNGSTLTKDLRLRYQATANIPLTTQPSQFSTVTVPFLDSWQPLAYRIAFVFSQGRVPPPISAALESLYDKAVSRITARHTRQAQRTRYARPAYGDEEEYPFWY